MGRLFSERVMFTKTLVVVSPRHLVICTAITICIALVALPSSTEADAGDGGGSSKSVRNAKRAIDKGDYDHAVRLLEKEVSRQPNDPDTQNLLAYSYRNLGRFDDALAHYQKALTLDPKHKGANEYLGELYLQLDELSKAEERLAVLDKACWLKCEEYEELKEAVEDYKKANAN
jgi:tetratricopeptide (TPR) repeat protein